MAVNRFSIQDLNCYYHCRMLVAGNIHCMILREVRYEHEWHERKDQVLPARGCFQLGGSLTSGHGLGAFYLSQGVRINKPANMTGWWIR
ncbi:hypothetical protein SAMN04488502_102172 [Dendrosporobacter quercicolus]|uniref:Uncharacterized protein n=1 Tax=Dendrosporobacter quercicolus TaxID=146817 RepID=A0A1G9QHR5_9FIRM|nr:hypothetical protein SAMN04488502_102172 [Dendrosporobacter quercicolus]